MRIKRIDTASVLTTITAPVRKMCPVLHETDEGQVVITYQTEGSAYELHDLAKYLADFASMAISHEDFTDLVAQALHADVTSTWTTAGMGVTCRASYPAGQ